jgi:hypothetical protein
MEVIAIEQHAQGARRRLAAAIQDLQDAEDFACGHPGDISFGWVRHATDDLEDAQSVASEWIV